MHVLDKTKLTSKGPRFPLNIQNNQTICLRFLSLIGGCTGSSESTLVNMPHGWNIFKTIRQYVMLDFFCSGIQFNLLLSPYPCFISLLYLDLYVLGDDALIS